MAINSSDNVNGRASDYTNGIDTKVNDNEKLPVEASADFIPFEFQSSALPLPKNYSDIIDHFITAWTLLLCRYHGSNETIFTWGIQRLGASTEGSSATESVAFENNQTISSILQRTRRNDSVSSMFKDVEESDIDYCFFNNSSQPGNDNKWSLQIELRVLQNALWLRPRWNLNSFEESAAMKYTTTFADLVTYTFTNKDQTVSRAFVLTSQELDDIWEWNSEVPPTIEECIHDIISEQCRLIPDSPAVESWDGRLTYGEVDQLSTRLAGSLLALEIELGMIPLCFEKSMWTVVAVLATMKAGAAFVLMDPSQPEARLRSIVCQVGAKVMLTSKKQSQLASRLSDSAKVVVVADNFQVPTVEMILPKVPASNKLYIQFTSGSTGQPKGVVITHANYTSGALPRSTIVGYEASSRVLDFASYAFDVSIDCMLCTLARGGCICVPSDEARVNDLAGSIKNMNVNMAHMTPSVARVLDPQILSTLTVLGLGGETVTVGDAAVWTKLTRLIIAYGPSECTVGCTVNGTVIVGNQNPTIGKGVGGVMWIVDPTDHNRLMPIGAVGELLVEGPIVGDGYLHNPEKTAEVFISNPEWLLAGSQSHPGRCGRLYKTGDLVKYAEDGSIIFLGRKDTQVKLRGQRVELSEVEHHLRLNLPAWVEVSAEVITAKSTGAKPTLVAFVSGHPPNLTNGSPDENSSTEQLIAPSMSMVLADSLSAMEKKLAETAPIYMIPSAYVPITRMPMMVSGKLDRKKLREAASALSPRELANLRTPGTETSIPQTAMEVKLQKIWSKLLGVEIMTISAGDNFFALGGDSIMVMRMVAAARSEGLSLRAHEVLINPVLSKMAATMTILSSMKEPDVKPFSLLDKAWNELSHKQAAEMCGVEDANIEDIYPCTPLQEALMALSAKRTESYVAQRVVETPNEAAELRLRAAWESVIAESMILRTRIVYVPNHGLLQVVINEKVTWIAGVDLDSYMQEDQQKPMQLGSQLARYASINDTTSGKRYFVWTIHHAIYDGWSMPLIMDRVRRAYLGLTMNRLSEFRTFIRYLKGMDQRASESYWRSQLAGANVPQFPPLPSVGFEPRADSLLEHRISLIKSKTSTTTVSTIIRAAWALVTARLTGYDDVVFGETLMGRDIPVTGAEELDGPMITTVPVRIQLKRQSSVKDLLESVHANTIARIHHEHFGLQHIRRLSLDAQVASDLRTGLVIQPAQIDNPVGEEIGDGLAGLAPKSDLEAAKEALHFNSYALMLVCSLETDSFLVMASFDSAVVDVSQMEKVLQEFDQMVQQLLSESASLIGDLIGKSTASFDSLPNNGVRVIEKSQNGVSDIPSTDLEKKLQTLWRETIGIEMEEISSGDNFFSLGGDSISAMKLVAAVRSAGYTLTVADVFRQPKLSDLARIMSQPKPSTEPIPQTPVAKLELANVAFSALDLKALFVSEVIRPKLADSTWVVKDVFPTTNDQEASVRGTITAPRFSVQYNLMFLDQSIDRIRLMKCWQELVSHHEILRTVFVEVGGKLMHVVLEELKLPVNNYETMEDIESFSKNISVYDSNTAMPLGSPFLKFIFVTGKGLKKENCLVIRMSHSQYDGLSLPNLFLELQTLYAGNRIAPSPGFSSYIYNMNQKSHLDHWRRELQGSKLSILGTYKNQANVSPTATFVTTTIDISSRPKEITTATFLSAGWALVLAKHLKTRDVTFGHIVSGRSIDVHDAHRIMGMCDNHLPIRVRFPPGTTSLSLLHSIQTQRAINSPYENTQFRDIILHCTDWEEEQSMIQRGENVCFDSMVHHQDIEYFDTLMLGGKECRLDVWNPEGEPAMEWKVQSFLKEGRLLEVEIMCSETFGELAEKLIGELKREIEALIERPEGLLFVD